MFIYTAILLLILTWTAWTANALHRNYKLARSINLPIILSPTATLNPVWIVTYRLLCPQLLKLIPLLPFNLGRWARYTSLAWQFADKHAAHDELGAAFVVCTPASNELHLADRRAVQHVLAHRKEFIKPGAMYEALNMFGKNVDTVEGRLWERHRKITAPSFNEGVSASVWMESLRQAEDMLVEWLAAGAKGTRSIAADMAHLTLHVFTYAGFGIQYPFRSTKERPEPGHQLNYQEALGLVLKHFTVLLIFPLTWMKWPFLPRSVQKIGLASDEYRRYLEEMVEKEKQAITTSRPRETNNLLSALVQASQAETQGLDDDELYGNLFVYNMAGHETTANAVATAIAYLAQAPRLQDWIYEEVAAVTRDAGHPSTWSYQDLYPKLQRCQALMFETLRLTGSVSFIPKAATGVSQTISIDGTPHVVPADTFVVTNVQALHTDEEIWGADVLEFEPTRWFAKQPDSSEETMIEPLPGSFVPWSEGPRSCPGKRFSQVEFTAVIASLFGRATVSARPEGAETDEDARRRTRRMVDDTVLTGITLQMRNPRDVALVWKRR